MNVDYVREVFAGHTVRVVSRLVDHDRKRLHYFHQMFHAADGWLAATNEIVAIHVDMATRRSAPFSDETAARLAAMGTAHAALPTPPSSGARSASGAADVDRGTAGDAGCFRTSLQIERDFGALRDRAPRVELGGDVGAADQRDRRTPRLPAAARAGRGAAPVRRRRRWCRRRAPATLRPRAGAVPHRRSSRTRRRGSSSRRAS